MNEKRSSIVGFALIGIILLVFSWYNTKQAAKRQQEAMVRDSLATAAAIARGEMQEPETVAADTLVAQDDTLEMDAYRHQYLQRCCAD